MATALLIKPTLEEVLLQSAKIGLPEIEAEKFFLHYSSNGWKVGKVKMACFPSALAGWKLRWQERQQQYGQRQAERQTRPNGADTMLKSKEYDRVIAAMENIKGTYAQHQTWAAEDRERYKQLRARREQLRKELGLLV